MNIRPPDAVLFDCDGVIADSEWVIAKVLAEEITALGWPMTDLEEQNIFRGMTGAMLNDILIKRVGILPDGWRRRVGKRISAALHAELVPVPGAIFALQQLHATGLPIAVASNSGRDELHYKLSKLGIQDMFSGRIFSYQDVEEPKPAPDIYLAAAASCGVPASRCVVVEDTATGARAGIAAGCRVLGFAREEDPDLQELCIEIFRDMNDLPKIIGILK